VVDESLLEPGLEGKVGLRGLTRGHFQGWLDAMTPGAGWELGLAQSCTASMELDLGHVVIGSEVGCGFWAAAPSQSW
jgi:hypothetical protein